ncbi:hypothetical protein DN581_30910, partial [Burkholderia multivorans]
GVHSDALFDAALARGIRIAPGSIFSNSNRFDAYIRIGCTRAFDAAQEAAFDTLGRLVRDRSRERLASQRARARSAACAM